MLFHTWTFLVFFAVTIALIALARRHHTQKVTLLAASAVFYMWWNPAFILLILTSAGIDYWVALRIAATDDERRRKWLLILSLATNIGLLAWFKYAHFLEQNMLLGLRFMGYVPNWSDVNLVLPVGISFYTFNTLSYTIDVYRRRLPATRSLTDYAVFVTFFPHLVAGPIVRASDFLHQLKQQARLNFDRRALFQFLRGLVKKVVVADGVAHLPDAIFRHPGEWTSVPIWIATVCFYVQIYCDFSGYTDMAIAIARMLGYKLPDNFNRPYVAGSPPEFWRRWHITLSGWLRDYLYIPLGGNRGGTLLTLRNLMLTMLLGGLWHGASWNFVLWGGLHGLALVVHRMWERIRASMGVTDGVRRSRVYHVVSVVFMQYFVLLTWIPFRVTNTGRMLQALRRFVFFDANFHVATAGLGAYSPFSTMVIVAAFLGVHWWSARRAGLDRRLAVAPSAVGALACLAIGAVLFLLWPSAQAPFIYFQF